MIKILHLDLYKGFAKKANSTKRPPVGTLTLGLSGILKEPCSILEPIVRIERLPLDAMPFDYTYARWVEADRYYFINDWTWVDGLWEVSMREDVLATYKTEIGNANEYVLRTDSTSDYNPYVSDSMYPVTTGFSFNDEVATSAFTPDPVEGCYIVGIVSGETASAVGAVTYYALTTTEFGNFKSMLFSPANLVEMGIIDGQGADLVDISQQVLKAMYNPYQYIVSCMWFPFPVLSIPDGYKTYVTQIPLGWWTYRNLTGTRIVAQVLPFSENAPLTPHPLAAQRGLYLNYAPFTRRTLVGRFGTVPLDTSYYVVGNRVSVGYYVDLVTGQCRATIEVYTTGEQSTRTIIAERYFLLAVPIQLAQVSTDYLGAAVSAIDTVKSSISGAVSGALTGGLAGAVAGSVASAASGIYNTIDAIMPQMASNGSNGSFIAPSTVTHVITQFFNPVDENIHHKGRPLCASRQLNTLSGFILCADADIDLDCYESERTEIGNYLISGFFWE